MRPGPPLSVSILPVFGLIGFLYVGIARYDMSGHLPLIAAAALAAILAQRLGTSWKVLLEGIIKGVSIAMPAILILMAIGILIGTWVASGVVPLLIHYGLSLLSPKIFLMAACLVCAVVSLATGSSWSTAGTVGVALMGVGAGLGISSAMVAGAVVSGSYFGDKLSPLSDTTNLASAVVGADLFSHIRHMLYTTVPSLIIALIIYGILGATSSVGTIETESLNAFKNGLSGNFTLTPWLLLAPVTVFTLIGLKIPALPSILAGALVGGILGMATQGMAVGEVLVSMQEGYVSATGITQIDELLTRGGLESMFWTISLIICAMSFGGIMESSGMLGRLADSILQFATSRGKLVAATLASGIGMNIIASDQYLAVVVPGRMYRGAYDRAGLASKNLSRCLEDSGTLSSPLIPWNTCGAFMMGSLGVSPLVYLPFAFLNLINPLISLLYGFTGWTMAKAEKSDS